jgi:hypothetical protein
MVSHSCIPYSLKFNWVWRKLVSKDDFKILSLNTKECFNWNLNETEN